MSVLRSSPPPVWWTGSGIRRLPTGAITGLRFPQQADQTVVNERVSGRSRLAAMIATISPLDRVAWSDLPGFRAGLRGQDVRQNPEPTSGARSTARPPSGSSTTLPGTRVGEVVHKVVQPNLTTDALTGGRSGLDPRPLPWSRAPYRSRRSEASLSRTGRGCVACETTR